jgi:5'-deoxynucleotidase YfbR-like HD superfamily hydrolase
MSMATDPGWHRGDWMQTYTGRRFFPMAPLPDEVDPVDIAHALAFQCRYNGHVDRFYSVAEHCVLLSLYAREQGEDELLQLELLLHDATEAYVGDMVRPLKVHQPEFRAAEARVATAIAIRFGTFEDADTVNGEVVDSLRVKELDSRILLDERAALMSRTVHPWGVDGLERLWVEIRAWSPVVAERMYLRRLEELGIEVG